MAESDDESVVVRRNREVDREIMKLRSRVAALEAAEKREKSPQVVHVIVDSIAQVVDVNLQTAPPLRRLATKATLTIGGENVATLSIDTGGQAVTSFEDDKGDKDAAVPANYVASFQSSDPSVLTVDSTGKVTGVKEGTADVSDPINDANGVPIPKPDGSGPIGPAVASVTIGPGLAVAASESVA